jgi:hypothetical protein
MELFHLGIDVAKAKLDCALRSPEGKIRHKVITNDAAGFAQLQAFLSRQQALTLHVCMEATGVYWEPVAEFLAALPHVTVSVINPAQIKAFAASRMVRTKTDKVDMPHSSLCSAMNAHPSPGSRRPRPNALCARSCCVWTACKACAPRNRIVCSLRKARYSRGSLSTSNGWTPRSSGSPARSGICSTRMTIWTTSVVCSTASRAWANAPSPFCWPSTHGYPASTTLVRPLHSLALTLGSTNPAAASAPNHVCPRSATLSCASHSTCQPWSRSITPPGGSSSDSVCHLLASRPNSSSAQ